MVEIKIKILFKIERYISWKTRQHRICFVELRSFSAAGFLLAARHMTKKRKKTALRSMRKRTPSPQIFLNHFLVVDLSTIVTPINIFFSLAERHCDSLIRARQYIQPELNLSYFLKQLRHLERTFSRSD